MTATTRPTLPRKPRRRWATGGGGGAAVVVEDGEAVAVVEDDAGEPRNGGRGDGEGSGDDVGGEVEAVDAGARDVEAVDAGARDVVAVAGAGPVVAVVDVAGSGRGVPMTASVRRSSNIRAASVVRNTTDWPAVVPTRPGATTLVSR